MISLDIADLVVIAGRTLRLDTGAALEALDLTAAEMALAEAGSAAADLAGAGSAGPDFAGAGSGRADSADAGFADAGFADAGFAGDGVAGDGIAGDGIAEGGFAGAGSGGDAAAAAAGLLHALIRHHPFRRGNERVAVVATLQFLAVNGWQADLDPPRAASTVVADLAAGASTPADVAAWLSPRLSPLAGPGRFEPRTQEAPMRGWLPGRKRPTRTKRTMGAFERFTARARQVVITAQEEARRLKHGYVGTEHILLGLLGEGEGVAARALQSCGIELPAARQQVEEIIGPGKQAPTGHIPFTPRAKKVLELSLREAMLLDHLYIGTEHILLGLLREGDGLAINILATLGAGTEQIRHAIISLLSQRGPASGGPVLPPGLRAHDDKIALVRSQKDAAIDAKDFEQAAALRDSEKGLLAERDQRIAEWSADVDVAAPGEELDRLHREVARLQGLLLQHGIEPGEGTQQTA